MEGPWRWRTDTREQEEECEGERVRVRVRELACNPVPVYVPFPFPLLLARTEGKQVSKEVRTRPIGRVRVVVVTSVQQVCKSRKESPASPGLAALASASALAPTHLGRAPLLPWPRPLRPGTRNSSAARSG
jgi:hypothetical protein